MSCSCSFSFRNELFALKEKVHGPLSLSGGRRSKFPILFMTATATTTILEQATPLTGLFLLSTQHFLAWPNTHASEPLPNRICNDFTAIQLPDFNFRHAMPEDGS
jgi:hypothetical protein